MTDVIKLNEKQYKVIYAGHLLDGNGNNIEGAVIVIKNNKITKVGLKDEVEIPNENNTLFIHAENKYVMPGLIDAHTHIQLNQGEGELELISVPVPYQTVKAQYNAKRTLMSGYTTIRDLGAENLIDLGIRDGINEGFIEGPRMIVSGYKVIPTGADFKVYPPGVEIKSRHTMDSPAEIRRAIRELSTLGVDLIKVMTSGRTFRKSSSPDSQTYTNEEMKVVVSEAHNLGLKVSAHAHGTKGVKLALQSGCDTLEHGTELEDTDIEFMLKKGIFLIPTFSYSGKIIELGDNCPLPDYIIKKALISREKRLDSFKRAYRAGVKIAAGSDAGMPMVDHGTNARELVEFVKAGMDEMEVIDSSTRMAAEALGLEDKIGTVSEGKLADIIIVKENPIENIETLTKTENIMMIIKDGDIVKDTN